MLDMQERLTEREQERVQQTNADRLNRTLFVLTVATTVFAPVQFIAGVYGMNFANLDGTPTVPELLWRHGYSAFWGLVLAYLLVSTAFAVWLFRRLHNNLHEYEASRAAAPETPTLATA